jgi:hypothetical protein
MISTPLAALIVIGGLGGPFSHVRPPVELLHRPLTTGTAREVFAEAQALCAADGGRLWGVPLDAPILLVDPQSRKVVASRPDCVGQLTPQRGVYVGYLPHDQTLGGTVKKWAGVEWVMLPWPLPSTPQERRHWLAHEMWHRVQAQLGLPACDIANHHLDTRDGRYWLKLEWRALEAALETTAAARQRAIRDALIFRAHRRALFPGAATEERAMEMNEGLAEYTGVRLSGDADVARAIALGNLASAKAWPTFVFSFAYASGPAYGLLLDDLQPAWRKGLTPDHDLGTLLQRASGVTLQEQVAAAAGERAEAYDAAALWAEEVARAERVEQQRAAYHERFIDGPILVLSAEEMQLQFDPRRIEAFEGHGQVYPEIKMAAAWGMLDVTGGVLISADWSRVIVPAPRKADGRVLRGDGWTLNLKEGWVMQAGNRAGDYVVRRAE